jgi:hypothetical protein
MTGKADMKPEYQFFGETNNYENIHMKMFLLLVGL